MPEVSSDGRATCLVWLVVLCLLLLGAGWWVYRASVQAAVYRREGIEVSTWEVMVGARPAERAVRIERR